MTSPAAPPPRAPRGGPPAPPAPPPETLAPTDAGEALRETAEDAAHPAGGWRRWVGPVLGVALLFLALAVLRRELAAHTYHEISRTVRAIPRGQVVAALLWTAFAYAVLPGYDALALAYVGRLRDRRRVPREGQPAGDPAAGAPRPAVGLLRTGFAGLIAYGVSQTLGFPAFTGAAVRYRFWAAWGLSTGEIAAAAGFAGATFTLGIVLVSGLALLLEPGSELLLLHVPPGLARGVGALLVGAVLLFLAWSVRAGGRPLRPAALLPAGLARRFGLDQWSFDVPRPGLAFGQVAVALVDWAAAAAVLWVLLPAGSRPGFAAFAGLFVVAQFAGLVSHVPGGLGVFETLVVLALGPYMPAGQALAALVAYRAVYYLLPFAAALLMFAGYESRRRSARVRALTEAAARSAARLRTTARRTGTVAAALGPSLIPTVAAAAVFAAGAVLLISGATPSLRRRVNVLDQVLPLGVIELSHLLGSVAGALLLVLAWALRRRLGAAWTLTVALLSAGVVTSLLKGLDWEEALVQAAALAVVLPFRRAFYRRSALVGEPFEPGWVAAIVAVLGVTVWVGFFSYQHVEYANDLWWRVRPHGDAPRFLRATLASAGALAVLGASRLLRPARPDAEPPTEAELARAARVAAESCDPAAYLAMLRDKSLLFRDDDELAPAAQAKDGKRGRPAEPAPPDGFVQYAVAGRSWVAMGDPVVADVALRGPDGGEAGALAALRARGALAWRFKEEADAHGGWPVFYEVSAGALPLYIDLGLTFLKLGEEARVDLTAFSMEGGSRKGLRRTVKEVERTGARFEVLPPERVAEVLPALRAVSDDWLVNKKVREKGFSLGFFDDAYVQRFPVAVVRVPNVEPADPAAADAAGPGGDIVAFANLWPGGGREELSVDLMRFSSRAPKGVMDYLFIQLLTWGKAEGYEWFNLGMAPLAGIEARQLAPLWAKAGAWLYRHGEHFYNYQGLRNYKEKFDPVWEPKYLASPGGLALPRILANVAALISGGLTGIVRK